MYRQDSISLTARTKAPKKGLVRLGAVKPTMTTSCRFAVLILSQSGVRLPDAYALSMRFAMMPSSPSRSASAKNFLPFPLRWRLKPISLWRGTPRLPNLRQVHLIPSELFASLLEAGFEIAAGDLGENITTAGLDLERMPLGTLIELGPMAMIELTGLRTPCVLIDRFQAGLKRRVLSSAETGPPFKCGVLGVVRAGGAVAAGHSARVRLPPSSFRALPPL
jgi:MOSC domain